ncbi:DnaJ C-terminal domain-containing protein [Parahaliea mediterranea]|uniref:DnaJ domain-containing protein n=1 Tax=Parahaliea mediterranea TaxID=651086 RepID=A0A939DEE6_9GAMM|nr:DnaJ C-terminal domain-containing protein [Parahaliea mediterranea]MBN7796745.1 DnaJ domain-containing protein [Parahaliea mediterranea]
MDFKDYYQILGVEPDAEKADIKAAYRKLARKYHPDLNPGKESEDKFKEVAEAWEVLGDDTRRAEFDELRRYGGRRAGGFEPPPGWQSRAGGAAEHHFSGDFSDFFNSIFGGGFEAERGGAGFGAGARGQDVEIEMPVFLEETLADTRKPVEYELPVVEGGRRTSQRKSLKVTIPAGVGEGERIRLRGQGVPGRGGAPDGDLYLHIRLVPHPLFDVQGHDLLVTVPVAPWEAALGAKVTVPTLDGKITLTIKPGSQSGRKMRVKGKGLVGRQGRGDLYAVLKVVMPDKDNDRTRELWQQLAGEAAFDPRAQWRASA